MVESSSHYKAVLGVGEYRACVSSWFVPYAVVCWYFSKQSAMPHLGSIGNPHKIKWVQTIPILTGLQF